MMIEQEQTPGSVEGAGLLKHGHFHRVVILGGPGAVPHCPIGVADDSQGSWVECGRDRPLTIRNRQGPAVPVGLQGAASVPRIR